jgi:hypothetical protein
MLSSFLALSRADQRALLRGVLEIVAGKLGRRPRTAGPGRLDPQRAAHLAELTLRLARRASCLEQASALAAMMRGENLQFELHIAVRRDVATLAAHAWVEHDGVALLEPADAHFERLERSRPPHR